MGIIRIISIHYMIRTMFVILAALHKAPTVLSHPYSDRDPPAGPINFNPDPDDRAILCVGLKIDEGFSWKFERIFLRVPPISWSPVIQIRHTTMCCTYWARSSLER